MILFKRNSDGHFLQLEESESGRCWKDLHNEKSYLFKEDDWTEKIYQTDNVKNLYKLTNNLVETLDNGWIDLQGDFWGCFYTGHEGILEAFFDIDRREDAERQGWIHITQGRWNKGQTMRRINDAQEYRLIEIGRSAEYPSYKDDSIRFSDVYPDGYPLALLPSQRFTLYRPMQAPVKKPPDGPTP